MPDKASPDEATPKRVFSTEPKILVTTDFSTRALPAVLAAADLGRRLHSAVELLFVVEDHLPPILMFTSEAERAEILDRQARQALEELQDYAELHLDGCASKAAVVVGNASREIVRRARDLGCELIVMASRGQGPLRQILLGSTAERVLHHAPCPVLIVPSRGEPAAGLSQKETS